METIQIDILNPEVKKILQNLADLNLIKINSGDKRGFKGFLNKVRNNSDEKITLEEITKEVEAVRKARYEKN